VSRAGPHSSQASGGPYEPACGQPPQSRATKVLDSGAHEREAVPTRGLAVALPCQLAHNSCQSASGTSLAQAHPDERGPPSIHLRLRRGAGIDALPAVLSRRGALPRLSGAPSPSRPGASIERILLTGTMSETVIDNRYVAAAAVATGGDTRAVPDEYRRVVTSSHIKSSPARSARCGCWCRSLLCQWCGPKASATQLAHLERVRRTRVHLAAGAKCFY
jgi:hypothetical protein